MEKMEFERLKAKVAMANGYLNQVIQRRGKIDTYDIYKVVTRSMRPYVDIVTDQLEAQMMGGFVVLKEAV